MKEWGKQSTEEIRSMQDQKLRTFLTQYVYPFSPHYKKLFDDNKIDPKKIRSVKDLTHIPFTSKTDLTPTNDQPAKFRDFILQPDEHKIKHAWPLTKLLPLVFKKMTKGAAQVKKDLAAEFRPNFMTATTGRTAAPISFLYSPYDMERLKEAGKRLAEVFAPEPEDKIANLFPYAPHLAFWQVAIASFSTGLFILSTGGGKVLGTERNLIVIDKIQPQVIIGVPGYIYHLMRTAKERGSNWSFVNKIVLGAEKVTIELKEKMLEHLRGLGAKDPNIFGTYGFTEAKMAWGECPTRLPIASGYHTYPDMEIFEIVNPKTGEPVGEGEDGEIVYSSLDARGSVVLRFRTGDLAQGGMVWGACPYCGRSTPRISSKITRVSNIKDLSLTKVKGTLVNLNTFADILSSAKEIDEWQVEISKRDNDPHGLDVLDIWIAVKAGVNPDTLKNRLTSTCESETEVRPNTIHVVPLAEILQRLGMETEMKEKRFVDSRPVI